MLKKCVKHLGTSTHKCLDVAIIGGGCFGVSLAYHLGKLSNAKKIITLFEKSELTAGSTWHAAGLVTYFHPGINMKKVHFDSLSLYHELFKNQTNDEYAGSFHTPGSLRLATTTTRLNEMHYQMNRYYACTLPSASQHNTSSNVNDKENIWINDSHIEQRLITPEEVKAMCPIIDVKKVLAGLYTKGDGHIDPNSLTHALASKAKRLYNVTIQQQSEVTGISYNTSSRLWRITMQPTMPNAKEQVYDAKHVVNCAGLWAHHVNSLVGITNTPLVPVNHQYMITEPLPQPITFNDPNDPNRNEIAVMRDLEGSYYLRQEKNALLLGPYESPNTMQLKDDWIYKGVPRDFGKQLFEPDLTRLMPHLDVALEQFPILNSVGIKVCVHGPIMYTPDVLPLVGPISGQPAGYWIAAGSGYGIAHAGGIGKYLAHWILHGEPPYDLIECDPDRFNSKAWADRKYVFAKSRESYGMNNAVYYPKEQRIAGRPTKRFTKLARYLANEKGAVMGFNNGWEQSLYFDTYKTSKFSPITTDSDYSQYLEAQLTSVPDFNTPRYGIFNETGYSSNWFTRMKREVLGLTSSIGLIDLSPFGKFMVTGKGSALFLDHMFANLIPKEGKTKIAHCIAPLNGNVYSEMTISTLSQDEFFLITGGGSELHDLRWLEFHLDESKAKYGDDIKIKNITDEWGCLGVAGPLSHKLMDMLFPNDPAGDKIEARWKFMENRTFKTPRAQIPILGLRISYTGESGYELYHPLARSLDLYLEIIDILRNDLKIESNEIIDFGSYAMTSLRIEKGFRAWSHEMNMDRSLYEAELTPFIKLNKECDFIGKPVLKRHNKEFYCNPTNKVLRFLTVENSINRSDLSHDTFKENKMGSHSLHEIDLEGNESIWYDGKCIGYTTSGAYSFNVGKNVAFAFLPIWLCQKLDNSPLNPAAKILINYMDNFYECSYHKNPLVKTAEQKNKAQSKTSDKGQKQKLQM